MNMTIAEIEKMASTLRLNIVKMVGIGQKGHLGGCCSYGEIIKLLGSMPQRHPEMKTTPGIEGNTGSLGQGLSMACGMAAGLRLDQKTSKVYCIVGDGEIAEGQIWEAAMTASFYNLDNLIV